MVLVNDTFYGGAGGIFSVASMHRDSTLIAQHEFGHTFGQLGDEYFAAGNVSSPLPCTDKGGSAQCPPNFTDETSRSSIKWGAWIAASTPIPTPASDQVHVGLFEGAGYLPTRLYRPKSNCAMRALGAPFCEVCKQTFVLRLYSGWGAAGGGAGSPANGVDVIEPGSETPSTATTINAVAGVPIDFAFALLKPVRGDAPIVQWSIDNAPISGATATTFHYIPTAGTHTVRVTVTDPTTAVHSAYAGSTLTRSRAWSVTAPACVATATRLCFVNNRYAVTVTATDSGRSGKSGDGEANVETADTGYFTLPALTGSRDNPEVVVKIVEVAPGQPWVFFGGLTDLEYAITVTDTQTGNVRVYRKPAGSVQNGFDVGSGQLPAPETTPGTVCPLLPLSVARSQQPPAPCAAGTSALCLAGNRFQVRVTAADTGRTNKSGPGLPRPKNDVFGFFSVPALTGNANNQEIFVKVIDGRGLNGKFWIFFGTLSDFEFTVEVLDTISGQVTTYTRPPGTACGAADTAAFPF
jgi:hypothetical protein